MEPAAWTAPRIRRPTVLVLAVAVVCGFVTFMCLIAWAIQGLDTGDAHTPGPLVVAIVAAVSPLVLGYVLRRWRGVGWGAVGLVGGFVVTLAVLALIGMVGGLVTG